MPFKRLLGKLKEDARSKKSDGGASRGKQAVDISRIKGWVEEEIKEEESLRRRRRNSPQRVPNAAIVAKNVHYSSKCPKKKGPKGDKGKGTCDKEGKGKGKADKGKGEGET